MKPNPFKAVPASPHILPAVFLLIFISQVEHRVDPTAVSHLLSVLSITPERQTPPQASLQSESDLLAEQETQSRAELVAILDMTGLDRGEYPEIDRVLSQEPLFPLKDLIRRRQEIMAAIPTQLPTLGWMSGVYGKRSSPFSGRPELHKGIDLSGTVGTPIYAPADGIVRSACRYGRFGTYLSIVHGYGIVTKYGHLERTFVKPGQHVRRGEQIATMGSSGLSTGTHLHYEVWVNDRAANPAHFVPHGQLPEGLFAMEPPVSWQ